MMRALTLWPEWCPAFRGVRFLDGTPSELDKDYENRPMPPWSTIAPMQDPRAGFMSGPLPFLPGPWFAMHAGKYIGGRAGNDGALLSIVQVAESAGWEAIRRPGDVVELQRGANRAWLHPDYIVTSAIVAMIRVVSVARPGVDGPWRFVDQWGWRLEVRPLPTPVPCKGSQGLWSVPVDVAARINATLPDIANR